MKQFIILTGLLFAMTNVAFAEQHEIFMEFHRKINPNKNMEVNRAPMHLPINVFYNSDTHKIEINGNGALDVEVLLYNENGILKDHSSNLNANFTISSPDTYIIQIHADGWYLEGEVEI